LVLPFGNALAVGDTFITIQAAGDVIPTIDPKSTDVLQNGYILVDAEVYSKTGNKLGHVSGYEFDPVFGTVTKISLDSRGSFTSDAFVFFSPEFVFVNDGEQTAKDLRGAQSTDEVAPAVATPAVQPVAPAPVAQPAFAAPAAAPAVASSAPMPPVATDAPKPATDKAPQDSEPEPSATKSEADTAKPATEKAPETDEAEKPDLGVDEDKKEAESQDSLTVGEEVTAFLVGSVISEDVTSDDGEFFVAKGTVLTKELVETAQKHDALLLLTMSVEV
jgi:hypothetical protein